MSFKKILPILAVIGALTSIYVLKQGSPRTEPAEPVVPPPVAPYPAYVAGTGLIESSSSNIAIGSPVNGVVRSVSVRPGHRVRKGQELFRMDGTTRTAELVRQKAALQFEEARLAKLRLGVRPEEIAAQEAQLSQARSALEEARKQLALREAVADPRAISRDEILQQASNVRAREEQFRYARTQLALLQAGTWQPDIEIARAEVSRSAAALQQLEAELSQLTVRAPVDGEILQVNIQPGEFASSTGATVLMGQTGKLHLRVEVDENDAWRVEPGARATAFPRGRRDAAIPLRFVRIEPYVVGKRNLTGESAERIDTRVLPVLYEFDTPQIRLYVGQQVDVYIEVAPMNPGVQK